MHGPLDVVALEASLHEICARHEALRTTFDTRDGGEPVQIIGPPRPVPLTRVDLRKLPPAAREAEADRLLVQEARRPFDLSRDVLLRATLLQLDDEEHALLLMTHHIVFDGWSANVLFRELRALYKALRSGKRASLPELSVQYVDYAAWQRWRLQEGALQRQTEYWRKRLANAPRETDLPTDRPRPSVRTSAGRQQELHIAHPLLGELRALCRRRNVTLYMVLLASWAALLGRYSGQDDLLIGSPFANRNRAEIEGVIGYFANTLVLRLDLSGDPSFTELLGRVRETAVDAFSYGELPFKKIVEGLHRRAFQVRFTLLDATHSNPTLDGLRVERFEIDWGRSTPFLALVAIEEGDKLTARLAYNADLFEANSVARMLEHFRALLESVVTDPERCLSDLSPPTMADRLRLAARRVRSRLRRVAQRARKRSLHRAARRVRRVAIQRLGGRIGRQRGR